jgi:purine nucleosidase
VKNIIMDCDTGQDDAIAIVLALASKEINVVGITTVGGNAKVEQCARNTLKILELMNKNVPVYIGEQKPLHRELRTLPEVFGESGMEGGDDLPSPTLEPSKTSAVDFLIKTFSTPANSTVCATAPMTNFGKAFLNAKITIDEMTVMGGCPFPEPIRKKMGNMEGGIAEYNAWSDPEAFALVVDNVKKINLVGLNVTRSVLYNYKYDEALKKINTKLSNRVAKILSTVGEDDKIDYAKQKAFSNDPVRAMHDVMAIAYMINPAIFKSEILPLKIGEKGQTVVDKNGKPVNIVTAVDKNKFFDMFINLIGDYCE